MVENVQILNDLANHAIKPFENQSKKCLKSQIFRFQVFGIEMVTVQDLLGIEMVETCQVAE